MIINDTNVRGIWSYSDKLVFEKGDFVVFGDQIYICKASGVMGIIPYGNKDYFTEYPGNMVRSLEEYYSIVNDPQASDDLYISSRVLNEILQDSYFGLGDNGIIGLRIESDGSLGGQLSDRVREKLSSTGHILDDLITSPNFNNGVVLVSRDYADIKNLVGLISFGVENTTQINVRIDPAKCIGCGACAGICPVEAIDLTGADEIMMCSNCSYVYTQEDKEKYAIQSSSCLPGYYGPWKCPSCGAPVGVETKIVHSYRINSLVCDLCGKCMNICPVDAITTLEEDITTTTGDAESSSVTTRTTNVTSNGTGSAPVPADYVVIRDNSRSGGSHSSTVTRSGNSSSSTPGRVVSMETGNTSSSSSSSANLVSALSSASASTSSSLDTGGNQSFSNMISKYQATDLGYVFVRQYSYKSGATGLLHRIQELVDPDQGLIFFRHAEQKASGLTMDSTDWKSCLSRDAILIGKELDRIRAKMSKDESVLTTSGFRYKSITVSDRNNGAYFISDENLPLKSGGVKRIVTLVMELSGKTISSYTTSIDLSVPEDYSDPGKTYYISDSISLVIKSTTGGFDLEFVVDPGQDLILKDAYCREAC
jgi:formate hydrogenlyase subunit 6/NADH:ubiquinone oxidoreductase subunit I